MSSPGDFEGNLSNAARAMSSFSPGANATPGPVGENLTPLKEAAFPLVVEAQGHEEADVGAKSSIRPDTQLEERNSNERDSDKKEKRDTLQSFEEDKQKSMDMTTQPQGIQEVDEEYHMARSEDSKQRDRKQRKPCLDQQPQRNDGSKAECSPRFQQQEVILLKLNDERLRRNSINSRHEAVQSTIKTPHTDSTAGPGQNYLEAKGTKLQLNLKTHVVVDS